MKKARKSLNGEKVKLLLIIGIQSEEVVNILFNQGLFLRGEYYLVVKYEIIFLII